MIIDDAKRLLLALDPIVTAEADTDYDYGCGGGLYPTPVARPVSLRTWVHQNGWESTVDGADEVRRLLEEWPSILRTWKEEK